MGQMAQNTMGSVNMNPVQAAPQNSQGAVCPECNTVNPANAKFCLTCGHKFEAVPAAICPDCGKPIIPGARFCLECGRKLDTPAVCPNCGRELIAGARFCLECGTKIE